MKHSAFFLLAALVTAGCAPKMEQATATALMTEVEPLFQRSLGQVPASEWSPTLRDLRPERVELRAEGLYIATDSFFVQEDGYFVLRSGSHFNPPGAGSDPSYTALWNRVYLYRIKG